MLVTAAGVFALILVAVLHYRFRTVMILLAASVRAYALPSPQHFTCLPSFSTVSIDVESLDPMVFHTFVQEILPVRLTLLFCRNFLYFGILSLFVLSSLSRSSCRNRDCPGVWRCSGVHVVDYKGVDVCI